MIVRGLDVTVADNGDLHVEGLGVIDNPLKGLDLGIDVGQLWLALWAENQHNKPDSKRVRAILLNALDLSVQKVLQAISN